MHEIEDARQFFGLSPAASEIERWQSFCRALFAASEFIYVE
jgi:hypothetical protein